MRANVQRPFPHQAGKISTPAHFRGNFAARQDSPPVSSTSPHPRRAAPGKTSRPVRLPLYQPPPPHPRRVISGEISQACQTARLSAQPHRIHAGPLREKLHKPKTTAQQTAQKPRPIRRRNARHPSKHSGQTSRPGRRRNDHSSARPPRPNFLRTKAPARRSPVQIGTPLTPRPATAQRCPARRWRP